jgi:hypothetical protein
MKLPLSPAGGGYLAINLDGVFLVSRLYQIGSNWAVGKVVTL